MHNLAQLFVRVTGWLPQHLWFRTKIEYEDRSVQNRRIQGPAIIVSNHTALYDFAAMLFVFPTRTLRYQMAEVLFQKKVLGGFLKAMGGIYLNRHAYGYDYMEQSLQILRNGGVVGIFPEGRLPKPGEIPPIEFRPGAAYLSMMSHVRIIPVWTNGSYFTRRRARVVIGKPLIPDDFSDLPISEKDRITAYTNAIRDKIIQLKELAHD